MAKFRRSKDATRDLSEIWAYVAADNPRAADQLMEEFDAAFELLARNPLLGRTRDDISRGLRSIPEGNYLIYYRRIKGGVAIARVLSGFRDIDQIFGE